MDLNKFKTDVNAEEEGIWIECDGSEFLVARYNNPRFRRAMERISKPYRRQIQKQMISEEKADELLVEALAEGVLLDWRNFTSNGTPFPYSKKAAREVLGNPQLKDFRDFIVNESQDLENFRMEEIAEAVEK